MANQQLFGYNDNSSTHIAAGAPASGYTDRPRAEPYPPPSDLSVFSTASRYLVPPPSSSTQLPAPSIFPHSSSLYVYPPANITSGGTYSTSVAPSYLACQGSWPGADAAASYHSASLKRPSQALYHHNFLGTPSTIGQTDWLAASYLAKRPKVEKDCTHYMRTRTCKFGESCKFDHPFWVPEGGIPDWKEVPPVTSECLPERPGEPDCPYFLKTQRCKFGLRCKFNHPGEKLVDSGSTDDPPALPERPSEPECAFYLKTGICKFGATCKFHHPKDVWIPVLDQGKVAVELKSFVTMSEGTLGDVKTSIISPPALLHNSKGLPIRMGETDCPFYLKTGSCKYGANCHYNHPERIVNLSASGIGQTLLKPPADNFSISIGIGSPAVSTLPSLDQSLGPSATLACSPVIYPQRLGEAVCDYYMKTGVCKFGERCRFDHPMDRSAPVTKAQETVKLTPAGYPRREGTDTCPYYMKTSICKYGATCKFDHPPPAEVLAMAASQAAKETQDKVD